MPQIRPETCDDTAAIRALHEAAFGGPDEAALVDDLRDGGHLTVSLVAVDGGAVVGHVALSPVVLDSAPRPFALGLGPVAVRPEWQRRGIGTRLTQAALEAAGQSAAAFVVVLGEPAFYSRFGFARADSLGVGNEYGAGEHFMIWIPTPGHGPDPRRGLQPGVVRYGPEFGRFAH
jgi:putative acetyltransferase